MRDGCASTSNRLMAFRLRPPSRPWRWRWQCSPGCRAPHPRSTAWSIRSASRLLRGGRRASWRSSSWTRPARPRSSAGPGRATIMRPPSTISAGPGRHRSSSTSISLRLRRPTATPPSPPRWPAARDWSPCRPLPRPPMRGTGAVSTACRCLPFAGMWRSRRSASRPTGTAPSARPPSRRSPRACRGRRFRPISPAAPAPPTARFRSTMRSTPRASRA